MSQNLKYFDMRTSYDQIGDNKPPYIEPSVNSILNSVHQRLRYNPKPSVPKIPKAIAETMSRKVPEVLLMETSKSRKQRNNQNNINRNSIQQLQADREFKNMSQSRRFGITSDMMTYQNQKRYRELLCQKRILEEMLKEHQKLQTDRDNIATEINYMRSYLDNIRNKLDVSLRKLNSHKTFAETEPERKTVKPQQPQIRKPCVKHAPNLRNAAVRVRMTGGLDAPAIRNNRVTNGGLSLHNIRGGGGVSQSKNQLKTVVKSRKPLNKGQKQWVYASRIDRKDYVKSIFV